MRLNGGVVEGLVLVTLHRGTRLEQVSLHGLVPHLRPLVALVVRGCWFGLKPHALALGVGAVDHGALAQHPLLGSCLIARPVSVVLEA